MVDATERRAPTERIIESRFALLKLGLEVWYVQIAYWLPTVVENAIIQVSPRCE